MGKDFVIEDDKIYLKRDLIAHLRSLGLPCSHPTIVKYEKLGIIPSPRRKINRDDQPDWRIYTGKELKEIGKILREQIKPNAR